MEALPSSVKIWKRGSYLSPPGHYSSNFFLSCVASFLWDLWVKSGVANEWVRRVEGRTRRYKWLYKLWWLFRNSNVGASYITLSVVPNSPFKVDSGANSVHGNQSDQDPKTSTVFHGNDPVLTILGSCSFGGRSSSYSVLCRERDKSLYPFSFDRMITEELCEEILRVFNLHSQPWSPFLQTFLHVRILWKF